MATVTGSKRHLDITSDTLNTSSNVDVGAKLFITTTDSNTSSTTALVLNSTEVEARTLGSNAFNSTAFLTSETFSSSDVALVLSGNDIIAGTSITLAGGLSYNDSTNTLSQTDNNTVYSHPTFNGDDFSIDTGALTGATVISDLDINVTTNSQGHVTDANGSVSTRTLTLANLGYTGATNANYITNNNQLTNGAGYITGVTNISGYSGTLLRSDNRTISPSEETAGRMKFGFTSWGNNNTSPYADFLHLRSYTDSSGGSDNLVMFKKSGIGMRIWQQSYGSATAYSTYEDVYHTGNLTIGDGGLTQKNFTTTLKNKLDGIAASANNYSLPAGSSSTRGGFKIGYSENGKNYPVEVSSEKMYVNVPWTDTTYTVGDNGLTAKNFTSTLKTKLDGIEAGADVTDAIAISAAGAMLKSGAETSTAMKSFEANLSNQDDWANSPVSILERDNVATTSTDNKYSPNLNFHWRSRVSNSLWMSSSGILHYGGYGSTGVPAVDGTFKTGTLYAGSEDITATKVGNWNTAYGWGNHASAGYMSSFILEDGDGTEVSISNGKEVKFVEGTGIDINWTDTSTGSDSDPYDLTFGIKNNSIGAAQINVSGNGSSGQVLTSDGDGTMSWTAKTANTDTVTSVGISGNETTGTITLTGAGATTITQSGGAIEIRSTDTNTTYTVGDGGLTQKNFTSTLKTKLDGIATSANNYSLPANIPATSVAIGSTVTLSESTDRADLLMIKSSTSTWGGLQVSNTSNEIIFSLMGDGTTGGIYDDQNSDWLIQWTENAGVRLYHNAGQKLTTTSTGITITGEIVTTAGNSTNWNTAYGWGDHASGGYSTASGVEDNADVTDTANVVAALTAGTNVQIASNGTISATDTNTVYTHPTSAGNKHIPTGGAAGQFLKYSSSGTATWATPSYTTNTDTVYVHPTSAGNKHIPTGGAAGQFLKYSASGTATWATPSYTTNTNTQLSNEQVQDIVGAMFGGNTETNITATYQDSDGTIDLSVAANYGSWNLVDASDSVNRVDSAEHVKFQGAGISGTGTSADPFLVVTSDTNTTYTADGNYGMTLNGTAFRLENDRRRNSSTQDIYTGNTHDYTFYDADVGIRWYTAAAEEMRLENDGDLHVDGDVIAFSTTVSDERLKNDVQTIENATEKVNQLRGVSYTWNAGSRKGEREIGVIAQEVEQVVPEIVHDKKLPFVGDETYKTVDYEKLVALLIESNKELTARVEQLEVKLDGSTK